MAAEATGTGKWTQAGVPHKGWNCVDIEELEGQEYPCEMCEARHVRFVHVMEHPRYWQALRVGCVCAGHATAERRRLGTVDVGGFHSQRRRLGLALSQ